MSSFFGIPTTSLTLGAVALVCLAALILGYRAWRWPIFLRLGVRQLPRRPAQTTLIVAGLALSSTLISASLATGDTLTFALRSAAVAELGRVDEVIFASEPPRLGATPPPGGNGPFASSTLFPRAAQDRLAEQIAAQPLLRRDVAALAPALRFDCTAVNTTARQTSVSSVVALPATLDPVFGTLRSATGDPLPLASLGEHEAYLNESGGAALAAQPGHVVTCTVAGAPLSWTVRAVAAKGGLDASSLVLLYVPLEALQSALQRAGVAADVEQPINQILVANRGDALTGEALTEGVGRELRALLVDGRGLLEAQTLLQRADLRAALALRRGTLSARLQRAVTELLDTVDSRRSPAAERALGGVFQDEQLRGAVLAAARDVPDAALAPQLASSLNQALRFRVAPLKQQVLQLAERAGSVITSIFLLFSVLSIAAGILLVFLIFSLLAAARRSELGITRALGGQRAHVVAMLTYEGVAYAALATLLGVPAGLALSRGLLRLLLWAVESGAAGFTGAALRLTETVRWHVAPRSVALAASVGLLLTVATVSVAAWRVSRLTIVTAIRDLPDTPRPARRLLPMRSLWVLALLAGSVLTLLGRRRVFEGIEVFALAGVLLVAGSVWALAAHGDVAARGLAWVLARARGGLPALRLAAAHTLRQPVRTGLTAAMFGLVVFMLTVMQVMTAAAIRFHADPAVVYGGWQIEGQLRATDAQSAAAVAAAAADGRDVSGTIAGAGVRTSALFPLLQLAAPRPGWGGYQVVGIDRGFARHTTLPLQGRAAGYASDRAAWGAVAAGTGLAIIDADSLAIAVAPTALAAATFGLHGVTDDSRSFAPLSVWVGNPTAGRVAKVSVIGLIDRRAANSLRGLHVSLDQLAALGPPIRPATSRLYFAVRARADVTAARAALGEAFYADGLETVSLLDRYVNETGPLALASRMLQLFVALGLLTGIAALAVISSRAALERRQMIGILRAVGVARRTVAGSLLLESALVVVLGSVVGVTFGLLLCRSVFDVQFFDRFEQGLRMVVPWEELALTVALTCVAALAATWLPARQAAGIPPVAALREV
ncbi:MAG TPA: FtsX-like permease family protein [Chloroflexota bacterium]|nr:FtsX-like permease family protein [Chloroflexota bacterium]